MPPSRHIFAVCVVSNFGSCKGTSTFPLRLQEDATGVKAFSPFRAALWENHRVPMHILRELRMKEIENLDVKSSQLYAPNLGSTTPFRLLVKYCRRLRRSRSTIMTRQRGEGSSSRATKCLSFHIPSRISSHPAERNVSSFGDY
ncbi:hypothetical protein PoB_003062100 [Plakobranchus ocellatus]|uniref:Uncharacterized protein n=1 Tax=Plakobranchus ocellatus TaxID=259542 RepID=A0AAV4A795_9GAST|nr:hypothetical protein PoB_003062100 [Plakobranchus ocellatus]